MDSSVHHHNDRHRGAHAAMIHIALTFLLPGLIFAEAAPVISNIKVMNITTTSATVSWSTDVPASSQVIRVFNDTLQPHRRYPEPYDSTLVTSHRVDLVGLTPNTRYTLSVVSTNSAGTSVSADISNGDSAEKFTKFTTSEIDSAAGHDYRIDMVGPRNVYAGSDLYFNMDIIYLSGRPVHLQFKSVTGLPSSISFHFMCNAFNPAQIDQKDYWSTVTMPVFCYNDRNVAVHTQGRLRVGAATPPGAYAVTVGLISDGVLKHVTYPFTVKSSPAPTVKHPVATIVPIPGLSRWETIMRESGAKWCEPTKTYAFWFESEVWYYDGGRVFFQIADYTKDNARWLPCALNINTQYRDDVLGRKGGVAGWRVFPHGLAMNYWRFGDIHAKQAVEQMQVHARSNVNFGYNTPIWIRELAYAINNYVVYEKLGNVRENRLSRIVDYAISIIDQLYVSDPMQFDQPFMSGLLAEALIDYYNVTGDPRIPPTMKVMLDGLWNKSFDTSGRLYYTPIGIPVRPTVKSNLLVATAFAWYWSVTGDDTYRQRGDDLFKHAFDDGPPYSGKEFSQNYRWSFDYVRYRLGSFPTGMLSTTDTAYNMGVDSRAPSISTPNVVNVTPFSVTVSWKTNEPTNGQVEIGLASGSYTHQSTPVNNGSSVSQQMTVNDLGPGTTYYVRIKAADPAGNVTYSEERTVRTADRPLVPAGWYDKSWPRRLALTIDHTKVTGRGSLVSFPLAVAIAHPALRAIANGGSMATADGRDVVFTNVQGHKLEHEIEQYNSSTGTLVAWVRIPTLWTTADTVIYAYFGNAAPLNEPSPAGGVWDDGYRGVWHLDGTRGMGKDSTRHAHHARESTAKAVQGILGGAGGFEHRSSQTAGSPTYLLLSSPPTLDFKTGQPLAVEFWYKSGVAERSNRTLLNRGKTGDGGYQVLVWPSYCPGAAVPAAVSLVAYTVRSNCAGAAVKDRDFHHIVYTYDGARAEVYIDGVLTANAAELPISIAGTTLEFLIGRREVYEYNATELDGSLDELRISHVYRSTDWIKTSYNNQSAPTTFIRIGRIEILETNGEAAGPPALPPPGTSAPLSIATAEVQVGVVGQSYLQQLAATGGVLPYTWTLEGGSLPRGMGLSPSGIINGTAMAAGEFSLTVNVTDAAKVSATRTLKLMISTMTNGCQITVANVSSAVRFEGEKKGIIRITTHPAGCAWDASSNAPWLQIYPLTGKGGHDLSYVVFPNLSRRTRSAEITLNGTRVHINQNLCPASDEDRFIIALYFGAFGRYPSATDIRLHVNTIGGNRAAKAAELVTSAEFNLLGRFIGGMYLGVLDRLPEYSGWAFQRNAAVQAGPGSQQALARNFLQSQEFLAKNPDLSGEQFVNWMYAHILGRQATDPEVRFQLSTMGTGDLNARGQKLTEFLNVPEYTQRTSSDLLARLLYFVFLQRDPTLEEFVIARSRIPDGATRAQLIPVINDIIRSDEYRAMFD